MSPKKLTYDNIAENQPYVVAVTNKSYGGDIRLSFYDLKGLSFIEGFCFYLDSDALRYHFNTVIAARVCSPTMTPTVVLSPAL